jgi:hypothetical protein
MMKAVTVSKTSILLRINTYEETFHLVAVKTSAFYDDEIQLPVFL